MNRTLPLRSILRAASPLRTSVAPRVLSLAAQTPARTVRLPAVQVVVGARYKTTKSWGPPIVSYEELKPLTEQPTDVSSFALRATGLTLIPFHAGHSHCR